MRGALVLLILGFVKQMVRSEGLAMRHFRWSVETCRRVSLNLYWFLPIETSLIAFNRFIFYSGQPQWNVVSRLVLLVVLVLIVVFFACSMEPAMLKASSAKPT